MIMCAKNGSAAHRRFFDNLEKLRGVSTPQQSEVFILMCAQLGYSAERAPLGGGQILLPLSNSRTDGRRRTGKTANESSQQDES